MGEYEAVRGWITAHTGAEYMPEDFFREAFTELMLDGCVTPADINAVKRLVDCAADFTEGVSVFGRNASRDFLEISGSGSILSLGQAEDNKTGNAVIMLTPQTAVSLPGSFDTILLLSVSSRNWMPPVAKSFSNAAVLSRVWDGSMKFTTEEDEITRRNHLASMLGSIVKKCRGRLITCESDLSADGFENDGILAGCLDAAAGGEA